MRVPPKSGLRREVMAFFVLAIFCLPHVSQVGRFLILQRSFVEAESK